MEAGWISDIAATSRGGRIELFYIIFAGAARLSRILLRLNAARNHTMSDAKPISVLGICGSLRRGSFNRAALETAIEQRPAGMNVTIADIAQIPLYDEDVRAQGFPPPVEMLRQQIKAADALLFACPEYNYSMSGVLKNAIDWASRPPDQPFAGKPVAIISAAAGMAGGARSQLHLRQSCVFLDMHPLNKPEVLIFQAQNKFDAAGKLTDDVARGLIRDLMAALRRWTQQLAAA
jgi:chromate reductase, NAD(P)H dehydrogenase (quinone)